MTSPQDRKNPHRLATIANEALAVGNMPLAWNLASELLVFNLATRPVYTILGRVAESVGAFDLAVTHYGSALDMAPRDKAAKTDLDRASHYMASHGARAMTGDPAPTGLKRLHLIRAWGFGFCSELDHVLGHVLLADIMGREPVVWWGDSSIFRNAEDEDAWCRFFLPVGDIGELKATVSERGLEPGVLFPPKWKISVNQATELPAVLGGPPRNITGGEWSRLGSPYYITRGEAITIGDYFVAPIEAHGWAPRGHWSFGKHIDEVYRVLVDRCLRLQPEVRRLVDDLAGELGLEDPSRPVLAVHVRESDKVLEDKNIANWNAQILEMARAQAAADPRLRILLITDSEPAVARYQNALPGRVLTIPTVRTSGETGVHAAEPTSGAEFADRKRLGLEVVRDIYLAARCERFMGVGSSNVAAMVPHLRDWPKNACTLVGQNMHHQINAFIHEWPE